MVSKRAFSQTRSLGHHTLEIWWAVYGAHNERNAPHMREKLQKCARKKLAFFRHFRRRPYGLSDPSQPFSGNSSAVRPRSSNSARFTAQMHTVNDTQKHRVQVKEMRNVTHPHLARTQGGTEHGRAAQQTTSPRPIVSNCHKTLVLCWRG